MWWSRTSSRRAGSPSGGSRFSDGAGEIVTLPSTRVEITLDEVPGGTRVRVVEQPAFSRSLVDGG